ncbi:MAG: radical SAM protein [Candidatus Nezhaarchaeales archaeon]
MKCKVILTADRTLMSSYSGNLFSGFLATAPRNRFLPLFYQLLFSFVMRPVPTNEKGEALLAPHGLRRVEAAIINSGVVKPDEVMVVPPYRLRALVNDVEVLGISTFDPLGRGPASSTFGAPYGVVNEEPITAWEFRRLLTSEALRRARKEGVKIVIGGPGAWQIDKGFMVKYGIDVVVLGEAEVVFPELLSKLLKGEVIEKPLIVKVPPSKVPAADEIPLLRGATVGGLVEVSRGCGRGCRFCAPTLRRLRHRRLEDVIYDVEVNVRFGQRNICLHAEDVLRYGSYGYLVNHEAVINLFKRVRGVRGVEGVCISHAALASIASSPKTVKEISSLLELDEDHWMGYQTGIETGSSRLIGRLMARKPAPFTPNQWPEVVEQAFAISVDNYWVPCATLIVNLPGEEEEDCLRTVELIDRLKSYKSIIVPLLFVPYGEGLSSKPMRILEDAKYYHLELYKAAWDHNMRWLLELADQHTRHTALPAKLFLRFMTRTVRYLLNRRITKLLNEMIAAAKADVKLNIVIPSMLSVRAG